MFDAFTKDQRQRRGALREARRLLFDTAVVSRTLDVVALADYILKGETSEVRLDGFARDAHEVGEQA